MPRPTFVKLVGKNITYAAVPLYFTQTDYYYFLFFFQWQCSYVAAETYICAMSCNIYLSCISQLHHKSSTMQFKPKLDFPIF